MDLGEAGADKSGDHRLGFRHRTIGRQLAPRIRAEMIAAENKIGRIEIDSVGDGSDLHHKVSRRHAGIAALVIDLVTGRFDQRRSAIPLATAQRGFDDHRM